jgi:hypothetical protein
MLMLTYTLADCYPEDNHAYQRNKVEKGKKEEIIYGKRDPQ